MPWFKVDDGLHSHPKAIEAGLEAMGLWVLLGSYCGFYVGQRGRVSRALVVRVAGSKRVADRCAERLVRARFWIPTEDGWEFHDWSTYQPTPESIDAERQRKAAAGAAGGKAKAAKHAASSDPSSELAAATGTALPRARDLRPVPSRPDPKDPGRARARVLMGDEIDRTSEVVPVAPSAPGIRDRDPEKDRPAPFSRMEDPFWKQSFAEAVKETLGQPWGFPDKQASGLRRAVEEFCAERADSNGWLRREVAAFVVATKSKPSVWSSFGPDGFLRWLNAGRPIEGAASGPRLAAANVADRVPYHREYVPRTDEEILADPKRPREAPRPVVPKRPVAKAEPAREAAPIGASSIGMATGESPGERL